MLWGLFHGLLLVGYRIAHGLKPDTWNPGRLHKTFSLLLMFHWVCFGWLLFRLESIRDLPVMLCRLVTEWDFSGGVGAALAALAGYSALVIIIQFTQYLKKDLLVVQRFPAWLRVALYVVMYFSLTIGGAFDGRQFIYFQF